MKNLLIYLPLSWPHISSKTFRSFIEMSRVEIPGIKVDVLIHDKFPLDRNRNSAVDLALSSTYNADYIFFADADQIWPVDAIPRLLARITDDFPIVTGLYWRKTPPHSCVAGHYSPWTKDMEEKRASLTSQGFIGPDGQQCLFYKPLQDFTTVQPLDVSGMGCVLVKADIFKKLEHPYFAYVNPYTNGGDWTINHCSEEMVFWAQCKKKGIKALVDPSVRCGHVVERVIGCVEI